MIYIIGFQKQVELWSVDLRYLHDQMSDCLAVFLSEKYSLNLSIFEGISSKALLMLRRCRFDLGYPPSGNSFNNHLHIQLYRTNPAKKMQMRLHLIDKGGSHT